MSKFRELGKKLWLFVKKWCGRFLVWAFVNPWIAFRKWLNKSRFVAFVVGLTIGVTFTYCYTSLGQTYTVVIDNNSTIEIARAAMIDIPAIEEKSTPTAQDLIKKTFPENFETMLAIAKAESKMSATAMNWNCYYNQDETVVYEKKVKNSHSTSCRAEHRKYSWSVDCGIFQINMPGKNCSADLFDPIKNIKVAREILDKQGLKAWVTYNYAVSHNRPI